jgi:3-phosphoshikimate 1-carboxyvinyltransferase
VLEQDGWIRFRPTGKLQPFEFRVPGDPSSAAFLIGAAALAKSGELQVKDVGLNPTRTGFLQVLRRMGADVTIQGESSTFGEPTGDLIVRPHPLRATAVEAAEVPGVIDEIPLLAVVASRSEGTTTFRDVAELKVKESDRLTLIAENLRAVGGQAEVQGDNLIVSGTEFTPRGAVRTAGDHRLAMAFAVLQTLPRAEIRIDDMECAAVSFPGFSDTLQRIGRA